MWRRQRAQMLEPSSTCAAMTHGVASMASTAPGETVGRFGASDDKEQKRRWKEAKKTGDCRPLFTSRAKCEDYWERWQKAWSAEWRGAYVPSLICWICVLLGNCACLIVMREDLAGIGR